MKKRVLALLIGILAVSILLSGCGKKVESKSELVDIYKKLDAQDFKAQSLSGDKAQADKLLKEIYTEPQLSKAIQYVDEMRGNHVRLELYEVQYNKAEVLEQEATTAKLHIESKPRGDYFTISQPSNKLGPLEQDVNYDVKIKKIGDKWLISEVLPIKEEQK